MDGIRECDDMAGKRMTQIVSENKIGEGVEEE